MKKTFFKNLFRDIKKTFSRFLSVVIIIAIGVSFYAGVRATSPDMKMSGDAYFQKNNLMDYKLVSTLGLTEDDLSEVQKLSGVSEAEGAYSLDAVFEKDQHSLVLNINSLPPENGINKIRLVRGRRPENNTEAVVEEKFYTSNHLKIGDIILLQSGNDSKIEDRLKTSRFKIVGTAESPLYVSQQRQLSSVGNGSVRGFVYILPDVFKSEVYTEIYVKLANSISKDSLLYNEAYSDTAANLESLMKSLGVKRSEVRYADVLKSANEKINEEEAKLKNAKKEAADKFASGYQQLNDARNKMILGKAELHKNEELYNQKITEGKKQIEDSKTQILSGEKELNAKLKEIDSGKLRIAAAKKQLDDSETKLRYGKEQAAERISAGIAAKLADAKKQLDSNPMNPIYEAQYNAFSELYEKKIKGKDFDSIYSGLKQANLLDEANKSFDIDALRNNFTKAAADISSGRQQIALQEKLLQNGEEKLKAGKTELEINKGRIAQGENQLNKARQEGITRLGEARKRLQDGENEIEKNSAKLKSEEEKIFAKLRDGEAEIQKNRDKLKDIKRPEWYVLGRSANIGYETYRQDSDRMDNIGKAFPLIFFLVAALVSLTTMSRMVQENRIEIGTFKALGYSRLSIVSHYLIYSLAASILGSILGISFGFRLFPPLIMNAYSSLYAIPDTVINFNVKLALEASIIAVLFTAAAAVGATLEELREVPASLMRPKPPRSGKTIFLEKVTFVWKRLNFTKKVTARNIFRYKQRFFMTVIGIAACTGLMITGFGLKGGIVGATEKQFSEIYRYDLQTTFSRNISDEEKKNIKSQIMRDDNVKSVLFAYSKNGSVSKGGSQSEDVHVIVPEDKSAFNKYINLTMHGKNLMLDDNGVMLTEKFSSLVHKKIGDSIELTINDKVVKAKVSSITEHYVQHFIYMSPVYYEKITGEKLTFNGFYGLLKDTSDSAENKTSLALKGISGINAVGFKNNTHIDFSKTVNSINSVVLILIVSAGVLAFVVIFNLTNININERKRELATIKLLGFYNKELALYIYRENMILTVIGSLTGIFVGMLMNRFIVRTAETNVMMFLKTINPVYFLYSIVLTICFSVIVNLAMYSRFDKIDMIESLKSAE